MKNDQGSADVTAYIAEFPRPTQTVLKQLRTIIRKALPGAEELLSYRIPTFRLHGRTVIYVAGWKDHYSIYPANTRLVAKFKKALEPYETSGKGTIRFPLSEPVPARLIADIAKYRAKEAAAAAMVRTPSGGSKKTPGAGAGKKKR
jgi:uncharacterized protein YdhG (YjbR/CyaY superfamily)